MKKLLLLLAVGLCLTDCERVDEATSAVESKQSKKVQFVIKGITETYSCGDDLGIYDKEGDGVQYSKGASRATIQSVGMTDLYVYDGSTLLKHQVSTDEDFGAPTVSLTYGSHDITFVASKADGQSWAEGKWSCSKVKETFATVLNVTVSGGSSTSRQVELKRRSSQVCFAIEDAIPEGVKSMHLKAATCLSLDAVLAGGSGSQYEATVDVSSRVGQTGFSPTVNVLTASASEEEDCAVMIEFLDASNNVLYHYERTISVKPNRCTNLKGSYFSGDSQQVSLLTDWSTPLDVSL